MNSFQQSVYWWFNNKGSDRKRRAGNNSVKVNIDLVSGLSNTAISSNSRSNTTSDSNSDHEDDGSGDSEKPRKKKTGKGKRTHKLTEIFEQEYFDSYRDEFHSAIASLKSAHGTVTKSERMKVRARLCAEKWALASPEIKARVEALQGAERAKIKEGKAAQASVDAAPTAKLSGEDLEA